MQWLSTAECCGRIIMFNAAERCYPGIHLERMRKTTKTSG